MSEASENLFEMANLYPATTGLPMTVWVSPRGAARHDVRLKVNMTHGNRMTIANTAIVAVRPVPRVVTGQLLSTDEQSVFAWLALNEDALVACWGAGSTPQGSCSDCGEFELSRVRGSAAIQGERGALLPRGR
jgi:hypothetical protein